ncbi:MAG TPA: cation diffusion facilitator family transporter [Planctomycetota bacterium]|nr:cation diffusion facilitator family transporter [Planctomycetota bacterium]
MPEQHHHPKPAESAVALQAVRSGERRRLGWVLVITAVVMIAEGIGGYFSHSLALLNDALHMLTHVLTIALSYAAILIASRPAPPDKTFRYWRLEILASLVSAISLIPLSGFVIYESVARLITPVPVQVGAMCAVGVLGLLTNIASAALLHRHSKHDLNIRGAFLHLLADMVSSVGVVAAAGLVYATGWMRADPIIAAAISVLVLGWCWTLVRDSGRILLESVPKHVKVEDIEAGMRTVAGVLEVHDLHVWTITSRMYALTAHVRLREDAPVSQTEQIGRNLEKLLDERWEINHVTLQFEVTPVRELPCEREGQPAANCADTPSTAAAHPHPHPGGHSH